MNTLLFQFLLVTVIMPLFQDFSTIQHIRLSPSFLLTAFLVLGQALNHAPHRGRSCCEPRQGQA